MSGNAYYNEFDAKKAAWLRELIAQGHIAPGDVDERSIRDVRPDDLRGYRQCHFFAGIGIWSYALRLAGWEDEREVWTGSCPCQPFSAAGKGEAFDDERHLWPEFFRLIEARRPVVCFGEQVSSIDGLAWFDTVRGDLDDAAYTCGVLDTCAAGVGAPHRRQRLYWVADTECARLPVGHGELRDRRQAGASCGGSERLGVAGGMADGPRGGCGIERDAALAGSGGHDDGGSLAGGLADTEHDGRWSDQPGRRSDRREADGRLSAVGGVADADGGNPRAEGLQRSGEHGQQPQDGGDVPVARGPVNGFWRDADWVLTRPQRVGDRPGLRPVERGAFPLAHGTTARVGRLRGYGDGIVAEQAAAFVRACLETGVAS